MELFNLFHLSWRGQVKHSQQFPLGCHPPLGTQTLGVSVPEGPGGGAERPQAGRWVVGCEARGSAWELVWGSRPLSPGLKGDPSGVK
ncbi:hypothetical protein Cadr_000027421 [Camelus dromedarius]|uniref:Uncharacterized protein n=1 Tax=Camelus dromedarius TaxID=9838 RepID=A0A5N4CBT4_CAMDR|nr:hypothetical protein Cadr_000027421 [Camelus dromedarius]